MSRRLRRRRCRQTGKLIFATSAEAEHEVLRARRRRAAGEIRHGRGKAGRVERRSYPCLACGGHHLTAMDEPEPVLVHKPSNWRRRRHR